MSDQPKKLQESGQWTRQAVKFVTAATMGSTLMVLSGLTLTATVIALIVVTPALLLFSPVLVPAAIAVFMAAAGLLFSGGCGTAAVAVASWVYNYVRGKHPAGADQLDQARRRITEKAREVGQVVQSKAHEVGQGS